MGGPQAEVPIIAAIATILQTRFTLSLFYWNWGNDTASGAYIHLQFQVVNGSPNFLLLTEQQ